MLYFKCLLSKNSRSSTMNWFYSLSVGNKIALLSLLVSILGVCIAVFEFKIYDSHKNLTVPLNTEKAKNATSGNNSPIIHDINGNVTVAPK